MNKTNQILDFIRFILKSLSFSRINNPYLEKFVQHVIHDDRSFYTFNTLESLRNQLLANHNPIEIVELGAGSSYNNSNQKLISEVAKQQLSGAYQLRVIFRLIEWSQSLNIVELGASLGLSSICLASANKQSNVTSFEGNPHFVKFIEFQKQIIGINNLQLIEGDFNKTYKEFTDKRPVIDAAFIDGNHRKQATLDYFHWTLSCIHENSILIFDDIHWSKGMIEAWDIITQHPQVTGSIDMYMMGIIFFNPECNSKHLHLRPKRWM